MYTGHVACCRLVSHGEYADGRDGWSDAELLHCTFHCDAASVIMCKWLIVSEDEAAWKLIIHVCN